MTANKIHSLADLFVIFSIAAIVSWYLFDAYSASSHIINLILVLPVSLGALALCVFEFIHQLFSKPTEKNDFEAPETVLSVIPAITLFTLYIFTLAWLGFDVGTSLFIAAFLWLHGERRIHWALAYGISFGFLVALFFSFMLPYPMPMLILPSQF